MARMTPRPARRPTRNGFWIFTRGDSAVGGHLLGVLKHTAQALEVGGDLVALGPDRLEALLGGADQPARARVGVREDRGGAVLRLLDHRGGGRTGLLALDPGVPLGADLEG